MNERVEERRYGGEEGAISVRVLRAGGAVSVRVEHQNGAALFVPRCDLQNEDDLGITVSTRGFDGTLFTFFIREHEIIAEATQPSLILGGTTCARVPRTHTLREFRAMCRRTGDEPTHPIHLKSS